MKHVTWLSSSVYLFAFSLLGLAAACDPNNTPVSSSADNPGAAIMEGVTGLVSQPNGNPVVGALVQPASLDAPGRRIPELAVLTNEEGRYTWPLSPGAYELTVTAEGYRSSTRQVTLKAGQLVNLDFLLEPAS